MWKTIHSRETEKSIKLCFTMANLRQFDFFFLFFTISIIFWIGKEVTEA